MKNPYVQAGMTVAAFVPGLDVIDLAAGGLEGIDAAVTAGEAIDEFAAAGDELAAGGETAAEGDTAANDAARCALGGQSFTATTRVLLANGTSKPIDQIHPGDKVKTTDPATGRTSDQTVTHVWINHDTDLLDITVRVGGVTSVIHATAHHPIWDDTHHTWTDANQLAPGARLHTNNGTTASVVATTVVPGSGDMWDLTVTNTHDFYVLSSTTGSLAHTYYVVAGGVPILVHNINTPIGCGLNGEPIYDIPAGSSGGLGAGKRIPPSLLRDYNVGKNADPDLPTPLCSYCRTNPAAAIDHVEPRIGGGDLTDANTTPACTFCNSSKLDRLAPLNPPRGYTGPWPPPWWPSWMTSP
jgi:hypothetical protein